MHYVARLYANCQRHERQPYSQGVYNLGGCKQITIHFDKYMNTYAKDIKKKIFSFNWSWGQRGGVLWKATRR